MTMAANSRRLSILSAAEVDDLYGLPNFTPDDRGLYFDLSAKESDAVGSGMMKITRNLSNCH